MSLFEVNYAPVRNMNKYGIYDLDYIEHNDPSRYPNSISVYDQYVKETYQDTFFQLMIKYKNERDTGMFVEEENYEGNNTTINELVKGEPKSQEEFLEWTKSRLHVKNINYLTISDQEELIEICFQEIKFHWKEICRNIEDSTLTRDELHELRRRLYVNVISICEKLFNYYVKRADILKSREVFSDEANFTRIKTLLACDLKRFLSIHQLKNHLSFDLKKSRIKMSTESRLVAPPKPKEFLSLKRLSVKDLVEDFRLRYKVRGRRYKTAKEHLKDIYDNMPVLEIKKIQRMLQKLPWSRDDVLQKDQSKDELVDEDTLKVNENEVSEERSSTFEAISPEIQLDDDELLLGRLLIVPIKHLNRRYRSKSMINLDESLLAEELGLVKTELIKDKHNTTDMVLRKSVFRLRKPESGNLRGKKIDLSLISKENDKTVATTIKQDLENLAFELRRKDLLILENDDNPLLMNLTSKPNQKTRMAEIKKKIKEIDQRRKKFIEEIQLPMVKKKTQAQPSTLEIKVFNNVCIRLSDIRVSTRVLRYNITCELYLPLYNDLISEIDSEMIQTLDRNLFIGGEVKEIYDELLKTLDEDHLNFELDKYVQKAPSSLKFEPSFSSSVLRNFGRTKAINSNLIEISRKEAPWTGQDYKEWNKTYVNKLFYQDNALKKPLYEQFKEEKSRIKSTQSRIKPELKPEKVELFRTCDPSNFEKKELKNWFEWWQNNFTSEDYLKYLSTQNSDYLGLLNHLYDNSKDVAIELTDFEIKLKNERQKAEIDRNNMMEELRKQKYSYEQGVWNPNTVFLGGLGNEPELDENQDPLAKMRKDLEKSRPKSKRVNLFKSSENDESDEEDRTKLKMIESLKEKPKESPKERLERVWTLLRMSDSEKIDMAIKYCTSEYSNKLSMALVHWESAADMIIKREGFIYDLENFERLASDPNRYFLKGFRGSSAARLEEALLREKLYKKIEDVQKPLEPLLDEIERLFGDCVRYYGRSYAEKMKWDRVEMLHYLTEERRVRYFKHEVKSKHFNPASLAHI